MSKRRGMIVLVDLFTMAFCVAIGIDAGLKSNWVAVFGFTIAFALSGAWLIHDSRVMFYPCPTRRDFVAKGWNS